MSANDKETSQFVDFEEIVSFGWNTIFQLRFLSVGFFHKKFANFAFAFYLYFTIVEQSKIPQGCIKKKNDM